MLANNFKTVFLTFVFGLGVIDGLVGASGVVKAGIVTKKAALPTAGWQFSEETQHWYKSHIDVKPWVSANQTCTNEGGYLAIINSEPEKNFLVGLMTRTYIVTLNAIPHVFAIGFYFDVTSGFYKTVDGQNLQRATYIEWTTGFPKSENLNERGNFYGFMNMKNGGKLENWNNSHSQPYVCEKNNM